MPGLSYQARHYHGHPIHHRPTGKLHPRPENRSGLPTYRFFFDESAGRDSRELDDFAPDNIELQASTTTAPITTSRIITLTFLWNADPGFEGNQSYSHILFLNDSHNSQYGPGIFLDRAESLLTIPAFPPSINIPEDDWFVQARAGDVTNHIRFGVTFTQPDLFDSDTNYRITWETPPGDADMDNGDIQVALGHKLTSSCNLRICIGTSITCFANAEEYGLDPIPGSHTFTKPFHRCLDFNIFRWFLPLLRQ